MNSTNELLHRLDEPGLSYSERARLRCRLAQELEEAGSYEAACGAMGDLWSRVGERPALDAFDDYTAAEVLLRTGVLSRRVISVKQISGGHERAKDLISESISIFDGLQQARKVVEARIELASCYWTEGALDEARIMLRDVLEHLGHEDDDLRAGALLRSAIVEGTANHFQDAYRILSEAAPLFEASSNQVLKGKFHNEFATVLENLGSAEQGTSYLIDRALIEYTAASFYFEQAGHIRYRAGVENNLGILFFKVGKYTEADEHLERARRLFSGLRDEVHSAQVDETRARVLLAQGRGAEAERVVRSAVRTLERGGEQYLLTEALTTQGAALARVNQPAESRRTLERAVEVATLAGNVEGTGRAVLTLLEEQGARLTKTEARELYARADDLLARSQHRETLERLRRCARRMIAAPAQPSETREGATRFVYASARTAELLRQARQIAPTNRPVLITGETGTGKELLARLMHEASGRAGQFVAINCATLSDTLLESQLFGHAKGSFTDAHQDYAGAVREAARGTLLLDEVAELSELSQGKLLRLIERSEVQSVGAPLAEKVDIRIIAATNCDLRQRVAEGRFRADLFYRLSNFHLHLPPLRERIEDIIAIASHFIEEAREAHHSHIHFTAGSLEALTCLPLTGNARELRSLIERSFILAGEGGEVTAADVATIALRGQSPQAGLTDAWAGCALSEEVVRYEKDLIRRALDTAQGRVTHAARLLGTTHQTLAWLLRSRHSDLVSARKPARRRLRSIISVPDKSRGLKQRSVKL